ncbi:MAG: IS5 family transposase [Chitinophagales bacterium]
MINYQSQSQLSFFETPFEQHLDKNNRWVLLADKLPWDELVKSYNKKLCSDFGAGTIDGRKVIAALIIKHKLNLSDREVIEMIKENIYLQYFVGLSSFTTKKIFHHTEFVHIRKRLQVADFNEMTEDLMREAGILEQTEQIKDDQNEGGENESSSPFENTEPVADEQKTAEQNTEQTSPSCQQGEQQPQEKQEDNKGVMQLDATVADQKIKHPNDVDLLNTGRGETDRLIDILCHTYELTRPRTYRKSANMQYLNFAKKKNKPFKQIRKARKQQLQYLKRNFKILDKLIDHVQQGNNSLRLPFEHRDLRILWATKIMYDQQLQMHNQNTNRISNRIVSIYQPYVRPIMRGKAKHKVEFGSKNGVSLQNGYVMLEQLSWDAYNECHDLQPAADNFKRMHGHYPEWIIADSIYHTRANKTFCQGNHIKLIGKTLSKTMLAKMSAQERKQYRKLHNSRNQIEGKFGQAKNGYELNEIKAKYANTSASWIAAVYFVMNILVFAGSSFLSFFYRLYCTLHAITLITTASQAIRDQQYPPIFAGR